MPPGSGPAQLPPGPHPPPRFRSPWIVVGLVAVLVGTIAISVPLLGLRIAELGRLGKQVTTLDSDVSARDRDRARAQADLVQRFTAEDFPAKLVKVRKADAAIDAAFKTWDTVAGTKFHVVIVAVNTCYGAVEEYNVAAAGYPEDLFGDRIPRRIAFSNPDTDCAVSGLRNL